MSVIILVKPVLPPIPTFAPVATMAITKPHGGPAMYATQVARRVRTSFPVPPAKMDTTSTATSAINALTLIVRHVTPKIQINV